MLIENVLRLSTMWQITFKTAWFPFQNYLQTMQTKLSPSLRHMSPVPTEPHMEPESTNTTLTQIPEVWMDNTRF